MARKHKQSGFTVIEVLLVLILIAIVGFAGYYVWHSQKDTDNAKNVANKSSQTTSNATKPAASKSDQQFLTIKEWGVKLPLNADLAGAYYIRQAGLPNVAYLSVTSYKGTNCAADQTSLGAINRFTASNKDDDGNTMVSDFPTAVKVGSYYYVYQHPQAGCDGQTSNSTANFDASAAATASGLMTEFKSAVDKIQAQ
jgi:prepilin-type N-terminal cleavage/methylation domain-containing protein